MGMTPDEIHNAVLSKRDYLAHQFQLLDIFEGNLSRYVDKELENQLSMQAYLQAKHRSSPINILPKVIDKLTNIYQTTVVRRVQDGTESQHEMLDWFQTEMSTNSVMNNSNELFNLCRSSLVYPYTYKGMPRIRAILNDRFVVCSSDPMNPEIPTDVILIAGQTDGVTVYWYWNATEFYITDSEGKRRLDLMSQLGNVDGINPIGRLPFVYVNESKHRLTPPPDMDTLKIVKLLPVMLSDLNLAALFQSFSIVYGIDLDDTDLKFSPNAFWRLKSDATSDKKPEIGTIKPTVDFDQVLRLVESQLSIWLETKGIKASTVGTLTTDNAASGISKLIDNMDTFEARQKQVTVYTSAEKDLWNLVLNYMAPYWASTGMLSGPKFPYGLPVDVTTNFSVQLPTQQRGAVVRDLKDEYSAGFISRVRAVKKLNPEMTEVEVEALIAEIDGVNVDSEGDTEAMAAGGVAASGPDGSVQQLSLNGAQVESMLSIVERVHLGSLPKSAAKAMIAAAFNVSEAVINGIIDPIEVRSGDQTPEGSNPNTGRPNPFAAG
jgi:hypothetical protein